MPIYEFICHSCGNEFEQIRSFSDSSMPECVKCGSSEVMRRVGRPAIHFKGSGWYITDSKKSNNGSNGKETAKSSGENGNTESKSETKAETKSESQNTAVASD